MTKKQFLGFAIADLGLNLIALSVLAIMFIAVAFWHPNNLERSHV